jgi:hypothetical protein
MRTTVLEVPSRSTPGKTYRVWVDEAGAPVFCECPRHKFHRGKPAGQRPDCAHMRELRGVPNVLEQAAMLARDWTTPIETRKVGLGIRFIEVQETNADGKWVTVIDLSRGNNLEV